MKPFSCILLAGGQSSRMGVDKATLLAPTRVDLLTYMVHQAELAGADEIVISRSPQLIPEHLKRHLVVPDEHHGRGPLAGIQAALQSCKHEQVLVLPLDMPALPPHFMTTLVATARAESENLAFYYQGFPLPCVLPNQAVVHQALNKILTLPKGRNRSIQALLAQLKARKVILPNSQERYFINTNTPEQWAQFIEGYRL